MSIIKKISVLLALVLIFSVFSAGCKSSEDTSSDISGAMTEAELLEQIKNDTLNKKAEKDKDKTESVKDESSANKEQSGDSTQVSQSTTPQQSDSSKKEVNLMDVKINLSSPTADSSIRLANDTVYNWSQNYTLKSSDTYHGQGDIFWCNSIEFNWTCNETPECFILKLSTNKSFEGAREIRTTKNKVTSIENIFVGKKYYWQVSAKFKNGTVDSEVFTFETVQSPRTINLNGVSNSRDIGGYLTESGKRVKQGMVYRSGTLDSITSASLESAINEFKITTDLDLRASGEGTAGKKSPLGSGINYVQVSSPYYLGKYDNGINNPENWPNLKKIMQVFADSKNYPVIAHCSLGRDRTGNVCMLLSGLLGVSKKDIFLDYELSFFSSTGCADKSTVEHLVTQLESTYNYVATYGAEGDSFSVCVEKYLLDVGLTQQEINAIKTNLLEK